jgi:hypothetical protein
VEAAVHFQGKVVRQRFGAGSKSEHEAVALLTPQGPLKLRRPGGNPFRDPELEKLVGKEIACEGDLHAGQLIMSQWNVIASPGD